MAVLEAVRGPVLHVHAIPADMHRVAALPIDRMHAVAPADVYMIFAVVSEEAVGANAHVLVGLRLVGSWLVGVCSIGCGLRGFGFDFGVRGRRLGIRGFGSGAFGKQL